MLLPIIITVSRKAYRKYREGGRNVE